MFYKAFNILPIKKTTPQIKVISAYFLNIFVKAPLRFVIETQNISKHKKKQEICRLFK